jgi:hypothetical protein
VTNTLHHISQPSGRRLLRFSNNNGDSDLPIENNND